MKEKVNICIIGEVCVDFTLTEPSKENKLRFGGIVHPARALWALGVPYAFYYISPEYLNKQAEKYVHSFGAVNTRKIGNVIGSPNVIFIAEPKEIGHQGYEFLLRDEYESYLDVDNLTEIILNDHITDIVIFAGKYSLSPILRACEQSNANIHIDLGNASGELNATLHTERKIETIFLSTSSDIFLKEYKGSVNDLCTDILAHSRSFVFKENRGGCRLFTDNPEKKVVSVGAQPRSIVHSVGVGDCFNVTYVALHNKYSKQVSLCYASWIAAEYASTTFVDDFKDGCERVLRIEPTEITEILGVSLFWEDRPNHNIYIAAPDFDYVDRSLIDRVVESLRYHNFSPRLPIRENGQMGISASLDRREQLFIADMELLDKCRMVVAVMISNDPGTLIEIGLAKAMKKPVVVYDPYQKADNLMLSQLPDLVSSNLDHIVSKVFEILSKEE